MLKIYMICGVDCKPGGTDCNNYCNHDLRKPMAYEPPKATTHQVLQDALQRMLKKQQELQELLRIIEELTGVTK